MKTYYFIGIKGSGMSALAQILHDFGHTVLGSDVSDYYFTEDALHDRKISVLPFSKENLKPTYTYILGNAFSDEHIEVNEVFKKKYKYLRYHEFLQTLIDSHTSIAVSGSHGKTTTTGLLSHVFNNQKPTSFLIGDGTGSGIPSSEYFLFEACEYKNHFLSYTPDYAIVTNIEFDHPDFFKNEKHVLNSFNTFSKNALKKVIACGDDKNCVSLDKTDSILYYGLGNHNDFIASNVEISTKGTSFDMFYKNKYINNFTIPFFGEHHILNTLAVLSVCYLEELNFDLIKDSLLSFKGVKRRFSEEKIGELIIIDDYAHHPTEIKATINSVKLKYPNKKIISIFQPHTFTRTEKLLHEFSSSFTHSDKVYLCDIFNSVREQSGNITINELISITPNSSYINFNNCFELSKHDNAVFLFMGAGDIQKLKEHYLSNAL